MDENKAFINGFLDNFDTVNPGEPVFRQAVALSLEAVAPYILDHPSVEDQNVMDRLTEPELAAEYHEWNAHLNKLQWAEIASGDLLADEAWDRLHGRLNTLYRFATSPHYFEADQ